MLTMLPSKIGYYNRGSILDDPMFSDDSQTTNHLTKEAVMARKAHFLINYDKMQPIGKFYSRKAAEDVASSADYKFIILSDIESMFKLSVAELTKLQKALTGAGGFSSKKKNVPDIWAELSSFKFTTPDPPKKKGTKKTEPKEKKPTKLSLLRGAFDKRDNWPKDELIAETGYDARNLNTALGILRNPKRTKKEDLLVVTYDRKEQLYTLTK